MSINSLRNYFRIFSQRFVMYLLKCNRLDEYLRLYYAKQQQKEFPSEFPPGHFYSPIPDHKDVLSKSDALFQDDEDIGFDINLNSDGQRDLLEELASYYGEYVWTEEPSDKYRFRLGNGYFAEADSLILYSFMRHFKPSRMIEVGSGYSSALMLDTNEHYLNSSVRFTFVEPFPERLISVLREKDNKHSRLIVDGVQNVDISEFEKLERNDILFIDSSHVSKVGSDVNYIIFKVLPALKPGVIVHFHDIFWPFEYPKEWVLGGRSWNEAYMLRAFLQYNNCWDVLLFNSFVAQKYHRFINEKMPLFHKNTGASLWLQKH